MNYKVAVTALFLTVNFITVSAQVDSLLAVLHADTTSGPSQVKTLNELFRTHNASNPVLALEYARKALDLAKQIDDKKGIANSFNNLGVAYRTQGGLDKALDYYLSSLEIHQALENKKGIATSKANIATIYSMKKDYSNAFKNLEESLKTFITLQDTLGIIFATNNLGILNLDMQLYSKAKENFQEANRLSQSIGLEYPDPVNNLGNIFFNQGNYQKAIEYYEKALAIQEVENNKLGILNTITNIGISFSKANQFQKAGQYLAQAEQLARELNAYTYLPPILKYNAAIYYRKGLLEMAYETFVRYDSLREQIYGEESTKRIAQMEMVLDFQEKEKELEMLQKEGQIQSLQLRNSRLFIVLVILGILIIIGVVNLYFIGNRKKIFKRN